jgi:DNA-binding NarL/FixJ family response regulator
MTSYLLAQALEKNQDFVVVDCVSDAGRLASSLEEHRPEVLLTSVHLKSLTAERFHQLSTILAAHPEVACVVLLDESHPETVVDAFRARAKGVFVCAESNTDMLQLCIQRVVEGQVWADASQLNHVIAALPSAHQKEVSSRRKVSDVLTPREEQVVWELAGGLSNREIAARLNLSENTVKNYVFRIFEKLGFSNRVEVVLYASTRMQQSNGPAPVTQAARPTSASPEAVMAGGPGDTSRPKLPARS